MFQVLVSKRIPPGIIEGTFVLAILSASAFFGGGRSSDWLSCIAVFLTFLCTQAAFDLAEENLKISKSEKANCRYRCLYITKEFFWIITCIALNNYPLISSTVVFATYPFWRKFLREGLESQIKVVNCPA